MRINFSTCRNQDPWNNLRWAASDYLTSELETLISMVDKEAMEKREPRYIYKFIDFCFFSLHSRQLVFDEMAS